MSKLRRKQLTLKDEKFCAEVAKNGSPREVGISVYGLKTAYKKYYGNEEMKARVDFYRQKFVEKYLPNIGDEIMARARNADDSDSVKFYQLAVNIAGMEAPKEKHEQRINTTFNLPAAVQEQLQAVDGEIIEEGGEDNESQEASEEADQEGREEEEGLQVQKDEGR